ncbi:ABC transporter ATP-binding protein [Rhodococcus sp. 06-412-2C]|uniref:dipeptide ABC transporter ATP-binding protein n=1 Tax=unclassified Rhodococcus (in: high G+C Gram-positive bacteria) TaxID=192944 RepID=UPI000B9AC939|nr:MULTISPECIES: ABC transporter ATP-binding protein [unclassified Rhodococcus (in: high G+C Gram-positive bacteria)]OZC90630.1 ABC transporter ATP-binding protein [Rhodococcus sp. 06-412-2C]OZC98114.1 ABC transporter ATP-binding protein [Rhodococcus sp. 06-412-2B]
MTGTPVLSVDSLTVGYRTGRDLRPVVHGVGFDVGPGQVLALVGESGSGKTTTGQAILGLLPANGHVLGGTITFRGRDLNTFTPREWRQVRGSAIGLIPQDPSVSLDPVRRVGHQVEDVFRLHTDLDADARRARVLDLFGLVGFDDVERRYQQYPHELSGGMQQRVLVAAAVASEPDLIIADEPTSGLDATVQKQVLDLVDDLRTRSSTSLVLVTHDLGVAADRSDLIGVMRGGQLVELGATADVLANPRDSYTRHLLDSVPSRRASRPMKAAVSAEKATVIEVAELHKTYGDKPAVEGISFSVRAGETFSIVGESGSGKSTTARILTGLTNATSGAVTILGTETTTLSSRDFRPLRRDVQIVYQNPYSSFDPRFSVFDVVEEPLRSFQEPRWGRRRKNVDEVAAALESAALPADFAARHPRELSGGQRQRVAIARALILEPKVLVLDEPISALDVSVAAQILELLQRLQSELGLTYVFISHDLAVVEAISDRVAVMQRGRIVEQGPVSTVFDNPTSDYTVKLLEAIAGRDSIGTRGAA